MSRWTDACSYRCRIDEEVMRANTVSPPPPAHVRAETTAIAKRLGRVRAHLAMFIPERIARRWSDR